MTNKAPIEISCSASTMRRILKRVKSGENVKLELRAYGSKDYVSLILPLLAIEGEIQPMLDALEDEE